jgi:predicted transcriptional regulator
MMETTNNTNTSNLPATASSTTTPKTTTTPQKRRLRRLTDNQKAIQDRREEVFRYMLRGMTQHEIAAALNVSQATVSSDVQFIQSESVKSLSDLVEKALPFQYEKCMRIVEETSREAWIIYQNTEDENIKLKCLREIRESAADAYTLFKDGKGMLAIAKVREEIQQDEEKWKKRYATRAGGRWWDNNNGRGGSGEVTIREEDVHLQQVHQEGEGEGQEEEEQTR